MVESGGGAGSGRGVLSVPSVTCRRRWIESRRQTDDPIDRNVDGTICKSTSSRLVTPFSTNTRAHTHTLTLRYWHFLTKSMRNRTSSHY